MSLIRKKRTQKNVSKALKNQNKKILISFINNFSCLQQIKLCIKYLERWDMFLNS